jgi:hypothetical protein
MMSAAIHKFPKPAAATKALWCSGCGATVAAACGCGRPYLPAGKIAAVAVARYPEKSNRMIAEEIGIDESTVRYARSTAVFAAVEGLGKSERVGRDGKIRRLPHYEPTPDEQQRRLRRSFEASVRTAIRLASYDGQADTHVVALCRDVAKAWQELARKLEGRAR